MGWLQWFAEFGNWWWRAPAVSHVPRQAGTGETIREIARYNPGIAPPLGVAVSAGVAESAGLAVAARATGGAMHQEMPAGITAVASISTSARSSTSATTCTSVMAG